VHYKRKLMQNEQHYRLVLANFEKSWNKKTLVYLMSSPTTKLKLGLFKEEQLNERRFNE